MNKSNHNFNGFPIDGSMRSQTQYNLFAGYLAEGFRASAAKSIPGDVSIFSFFFAILNLAACISSGILIIIWFILSGLFRLIFRRNMHSEDDIPVSVNESSRDSDWDYTPEELDYYLSDEYAELCEKRENKL